MMYEGGNMLPPGTCENYPANTKAFVHIPKNAGMTIRHSPFLKHKIAVSVAKNCINKEYVDNVMYTMRLLGDHDGLHHARWRELNEQYREKYQAFAVARNPWDRVVSRFLFAKKVIFVEGKAPKNYADTSSLEAFLEERFKWGNKDYMWHRAIRCWFPAFDHVSDEEGNNRCDIIRFEHLNQDLEKYFNLNKSMTRARNVTGLTKDYKEHYTDKTIQIVADWYKKDIDFWGYDFDSGAKRNYWNTTEEGWRENV